MPRPKFLARLLFAILGGRHTEIVNRVSKTRAIDTILAKDQLQAIQATLRTFGTEYFCACFFWILTKMASGVPGVENSRIVPFQFNRVQHHIFPRLARNNRVLKARQPGFTTFFLLVRLLLNVVTEGGKVECLLVKNSKYATQHFMIARRAYRLFGAQDPYDNTKNDLCRSLKENLLHTQYANRRELFFDYLDSKLIVESAEVEEAGQGITLHHVVASEVPRWPGDPEATISNIKGALVPGGTCDEEGTGNGAAGYFYTEYLSDMDSPDLGNARAHFYSWFMTDEFDMHLE